MGVSRRCGGLLDPLYSQGFDFISYTCFGIFEILSDALAGKDVAEARTRYNELSSKQFHTWFESIYKDKYYYLGDLELMTVAFYLDIRPPSATIDCLEKYRSLVRTKYRLEAYATLLRRVVAVGSRR